MSPATSGAPRPRSGAVKRASREPSSGARKRPWPKPTTWTAGVPFPSAETRTAPGCRSPCTTAGGRRVRRADGRRYLLEDRVDLAERRPRPGRAGALPVVVSQRTSGDGAMHHVQPPRPHALGDRREETRVPEAAERLEVILVGRGELARHRAEERDGERPAGDVGVARAPRLAEPDAVEARGELVAVVDDGSLRDFHDDAWPSASSRIVFRSHRESSGTAVSGARMPLTPSPGLKSHPGS